MTNISAIPRLLDTIRRHLDAPSSPARNASLMLAEALRDPHLNRDMMRMTIAALIDYKDAQVIERMTYERERG